MNVFASKGTNGKLYAAGVFSPRTKKVHDYHSLVKVQIDTGGNKIKTQICAMLAVHSSMVALIKGNDQFARRPADDTLYYILQRNVHQPDR